MPRIGVVGHIEWVEFIPLERFPREGEVVHASEVFAAELGARHGALYLTRAGAP